MLSGLNVKAHEFHYYDSSNNGTDATAEKPGSGRSWECIHSGSDHIWGYPHLWYPSCPELTVRIADALKEYRRKSRNRQRKSSLKRNRLQRSRKRKADSWFALNCGANLLPLPKSVQMHKKWK
jgi:hypothetical protein